MPQHPRCSWQGHYYLPHYQVPHYPVSKTIFIPHFICMLTIKHSLSLFPKIVFSKILLLCSLVKNSNCHPFTCSLMLTIGGCPFIHFYAPYPSVLTYVHRIVVTSKCTSLALTSPLRFKHISNSETTNAICLYITIALFLYSQEAAILYQVFKGKI